MKKSMNKRVLIATAVASLAMVSIAFADEGALVATNPNTDTTWQAKQEEMKAQKEAKRAEWETKQAEAKAQRKEALKQKRADRCAKIQERITDRLTNFDTIQNKHMAVYTNMQNRIQKFIDRLTAAGVDTTKVKTDLTELQTKITKFSTDYKAYMTALGDAKTFQCGDTDLATTTDVKTKMQSAKAALVIVHQDAKDIRTFMRTTVMVDILALKKQAAAVNATTEEEAETESVKPAKTNKNKPVETTSTTETTNTTSTTEKTGTEL